MQETTLPALLPARVRRERLTPAQRALMEALGAGYVVCTHPFLKWWRDDGNTVFLGTGACLKWTTLERLKWRGLIEEAGRIPSPTAYGGERCWMVFFQLTLAGWQQYHAPGRRKPAPLL